MPINGLVTMTPTSVDKAGGGTETATINANGSVTFANCTTLSLNGIFTSSYDNYMIISRTTGSGSALAVRFRLRAAGTDNTSTSSYQYQLVLAATTTLTYSRVAQNYGQGFLVDSAARDNATTYFFGPKLSQPTGWIVDGGYGETSLYQYGGLHDQSTAYDGLSLIMPSGYFAGLVTVYGLNQ